MIIEFEATLYQDDGDGMVVNIEGGRKGELFKDFVGAYHFEPYRFRYAEEAEEAAAKKFVIDLKTLIQTLRDQEASYG